MNQRDNDQRREGTDPQTDVPAEANTTKHINFLDDESNDNNENRARRDDAVKERQRQWREGLEQGRRANNKED